MTPKIEIENVFGYPVIRIQCPDESLYRNIDLEKSINKVFNRTEVKFRIRDRIGDSHVGGGLTTVGETYLKIVHLPGASELTKWVTEQFLNFKDVLGVKKPANDIVYKRAWANRILRGGQGKCHRHVEFDMFLAEFKDLTSENFRADAVGIFYIDVPENSSNLVFIKDGLPDTVHTEFKEENKWYLNPREGELIIHSPVSWHAVTEHHSDLPRNCIVFDADYV